MIKGGLRRSGWCRGFGLVELVAVMLVAGVLLGLASSAFRRSPATALRIGGEQLAGAVELARTTAIARRKPVALALVEPGRAGFDDGACRLGLFVLDDGPSSGGASGELLRRWQVLPDGVAFFGGEVTGFDNLRDVTPMQVRWRQGARSEVLPAMVFTPRGGLCYPEGSRPVAVKLGNGTYRDGRAVRTPKGGSRALRIGRVVARAWKLEG